MANFPLLPERRFEQFDGVAPDPVRAEVSGLHSAHSIKGDKTPIAVSYVIIRSGGRVLLQLRKGTGYMDGHWATAAAGHVEAGEASTEAAIREAREELGITIAAKDLVPLTTMHRSQTSSAAVPDRIDHFFTCDAWSGTPRIMEPEKAAELQWASLETLPEKLVPHERYVLEYLRSGLPPTVTFGLLAPDAP